MEPSEIPFRDLFLDYIGPFTISRDGKKVKAYILILTCLWSRAINLELCTDMSVEKFLRAFQLHIYRHGAPSRVYSDLGSNLVAAGSVISNYLNDAQTRSFFSQNNMKQMSFSQYYKGCSKLGSLVESCVKIVKRLIYGIIKNLVLTHDDFQFLVAQVVHLVNRRPVAFKEALRDCSVNSEVPSPITPEILLYGREFVSLNVVPEPQSSEDDPNWGEVADATEIIKVRYQKLKKARKYLQTLYHEQFIPQLISQSVNVKDRYKPVTHNTVAVGDIVLLKDPMLKPSSYPLAVVTKTTVNELGETTAVEARKGNNREVVKRHVDSVISLLTPNLSPGANSNREFACV